MAVLAFAAAGAAIGSAFGYATVGWAVGSIIGNALFPQKLPDQEGPRLSDLKVQSSAYGNTIPIVYGTVRLAGNVIWAADIAEHKHEEEVGGKGGPSQEVTTYTYTASFAVSLCEGPIAGVRRIWADGKLIFDASASNTSPVQGASSGSWLSGLFAQAAQTQSTPSSQAFVVYPGDEAQLPDPTIEAYLGAGNVPAYRGQAYVVFTDLLLTDYGNRIPNLTFEAVTAGGYQFASLGSVDISPGTSQDTLGVVSCVNGDGVHAFRQSGDAALSFRHYLVNRPNYAELATIYTGLALSGSLTANVMQGKADEPGVAAIYQNGLQRTIHYWNTDGFHFFLEPPKYNGSYEAYGQYHWRRYGSDFYFCSAISATPGVPNGHVYRYTVGLVEGTDPVSQAASSPVAVGQSATDIEVIGDKLYRLVRVDSNTIRIDVLDALTLTLLSSSANHFIGWSALALSGSPTGSLYILGATLLYEWTPATDSLSTVAVWQVAGGNDMVVLHYYGGRFIASWHIDTWYAAISFSANAVSLSTVVTNLSERAGLAAADLNVAALTDSVDGYVIANQTPVRACLEQLAPVYQFDAVESDGKVKYVKRGGASVATIALDDLVPEEAR